MIRSILGITLFLGSNAAHTRLGTRRAASSAARPGAHSGNRGVCRRVGVCVAAVPSRGRGRQSHDSLAGLRRHWVYSIILVICAGHMVALRRKKRSGGQSPRQPAAGAGGQASQRLPSVGLGRRRQSGGHGRQHTAIAARRRLSRPALLGSGSLWRRHPRELLAAAADNRHTMSAQVVKLAVP